MASTHLGSHQTEAEEAASALRTPPAIRERCQTTAVARAPWRSRWFTVDEAFMETAANEVVAATRKRYPKLHIPLPQPLAPFRGRWRRPQGRARRGCSRDVYRRARATR